MYDYSKYYWEEARHFWKEARQRSAQSIITYTCTVPQPQEKNIPEPMFQVGEKVILQIEPKFGMNPDMKEAVGQIGIIEVIDIYKGDFVYIVNHPKFHRWFSYSNNGIKKLINFCTSSADESIHYNPANSLSKYHFTETACFVLGVYKELPPKVYSKMFEYGFIPDKEHYLHIGLSSAAYVSFTESKEKGELNRQTPIKIGKYLKKYSKLTDPQIAEISAIYRKEVLGYIELKFARTREEIRYVYENGPNSCMSHGPDHYSAYISSSEGRVHPCEVYATPDISLAYIEREDRITGRVICNEIEKTYTRIYGDSITLEYVLELHGYSSGGSLEGCTLLRIETHYGDLVAPYIDGFRKVSDEGDYLLLCDEGDYRASDTSGLLVETFHCACCLDQIEEDNDPIEIFDGDYVCYNCAEEYYISAIHRNGYEYLFHIDTPLWEYDGYFYTEEGLASDDLYLINGRVYEEDKVVLPVDYPDYRLIEDCYEYEGDWYYHEENYLEAKEEDNEEVA